ncbi:hypothetical protein PLESTF_000841300 [Pleodorina starrii]|nr:hypothetical protein PLESTF_000841300 [Pleodorina starrii]
MSNMSNITRVDNSTNPNFRHMYSFHTREQWPQPSSSYTVFHGERPELPVYIPKYTITPSTAALASRHGSSPYSFRSTAERVGSAPDGRATYRYSAASTGPSLTSPGTGASWSGTGKEYSNTLGSSGLPPVVYKSFSTEHRDEYREPVVGHPPDTGFTRPSCVWSVRPQGMAELSAGSMYGT